MATRGAFDTKLKGGSTSGPLGFYKTYRFGGGARQPLFTGGELFGGYKLGRGNFQPWYGERATNEGGEWSAGALVPLAKNRRIDQRRAALFRARYGRDAVEPDIQRRIIDLIWEASYAYWEWVAAGRNYRIAQSLLELAQQRAEGLQKRVEAGDLPRIELTDNQRLIVTRRAAVIDARRKLRQAAIKLSLFFRDPGGQPIVPTDSQLPPAFPPPTAIDRSRLDADIERAMANRPELRYLAALRSQLMVDRSQANNETLPEVDAVVFASKDIGAPASSKNDKTPFEMEASLQVNVPLQRRKARGKLWAINGKLAQLSAKTGFTRDKIASEVQQAYVAMSAAYEQVARARESFELARAMERAERRKFDLGNSNLLLVNLRELATASAAKTVVQGMLQYYQARADYRAVTALSVSGEAAAE